MEQPGEAPPPSAPPGVGELEPSVFVPIVDADGYRRAVRGGSFEDRLHEAHQEGYREGVRQGLAEGKRQSLAELESARHLFLQAAVEFQRARRQLLHEVEADMVRLAVAVAERVIRKESEENRELVIATVRDALRRVEGEDHLVIRVSSVDLAAARAHAELWQDVLDGAKKIEIVADRRVPPGGCMIDTRAAQVDARLGAQIDEISQAMLETLEDQDEPVVLEGASPEDPTG